MKHLATETGVTLVINPILLCVAYILFKFYGLCVLKFNFSLYTIADLQNAVIYESVLLIYT